MDGDQAERAEPQKTRGVARPIGNSRPGLKATEKAEKPPVMESCLPPTPNSVLNQRQSSEPAGSQAAEYFEATRQLPTHGQRETVMVTARLTVDEYPVDRIQFQLTETMLPD